MIRDTAMHVNLIFCIFFFLTEVEILTKIMTEKWSQRYGLTVGVAFISVFFRNIVHFLKGLILIVCNSCSGVQK